MSENLHARVEATRLVVIALLASHLAHDLRPDVTAQALLDAVLADELEVEVARETRKIAATALGLAEIARGDGSHDRA